MSEASISNQTFRHAGWIVLAALGLAFFVYLASGIYSIKPEQTGVIKRFGRIVEDDVQPGIHYHWPWPIESLARPSTKEVQTLTMTFDRTKAAGLEADGGALLTGDGNMVLLTLRIQYTIDSPMLYLTTAQNPFVVLERMIQASVIRVFSSLSVDDVLTSGRNATQTTLRNEIQEACNRLDLGIRLVSIQIQRIEPPQSVASAFKDVASAREDAHKLVQEAEGERNRRLPQARAQAVRQLREAEAQSNEAVSMAQGDAEKFLSTLTEYRKSKGVTAKRLYLETVEEILPRVKKQLINPQAEAKVRARPW